MHTQPSLNPSDPRDALQTAILETFHNHYQSQPDVPLLYTLDTPTGTGKSAIFIRMVHEFFAAPTTSPRRLPIFVSLNYKLLAEQESRLRSANIDSYLIRSVTELNKQTAWPQKHAAIRALNQLYKDHQFDGFSDYLRPLLKQEFVPEGAWSDQNPTAIAGPLRQAIEKLLQHLSSQHTPDSWRALLTSRTWYTLLRYWAPLHLLAIAPAPVLITGHSLSKSHRIVLPQSSSWRLNTFSDFAERMQEWNGLHGQAIADCILVMDEADALYKPCLETLSTNLGKVDIVRCLQQFSKFAMWSFIEKMKEAHWSFMVPRIASLIEWLRHLPMPSKSLTEKARKLWLLDNAQRYREENVAHDSLFPSPLEYPEWWMHFLEHDYDSDPVHIRQKLFACKELWRRACSFHRANAKKGVGSTPFDLCCKWTRQAMNCNNILMSTADYDAYRATVGGIFYSDSATTASGIFDDAYLIAEPRRDHQYNLVLGQPGSKKSNTPLSCVEYLQMIRAMHQCITNIHWEWRSEGRDANEYRDLFDYIHKFQGRLSRSLPDDSIDENTLMDDVYVYEKMKSKTDLHDAAMAQHQSVQTQAINVNVQQTMGSPEWELVKWLNAGHTVVLSSATVGLPNVHFGTYNTAYIARQVKSARTLVQEGLSTLGQEALQKLHEVYNKQHTVVTTIIEESDPTLGSESWVDQWMMALAQRGLLETARSNIFTTRTRNNGIRMLGEFIHHGLRNGLIMHLTNRDIQDFINKLMLAAPQALAPIAFLDQTYRIDVQALCRWLLLDPAGLPNHVRIALYNRDWRNQFLFANHKTRESDVFETAESPLLLFSPLGSADRGINFAFTYHGKLMDLELLALVCNPYYGGDLLKDRDDWNEVVRWQEFSKIMAGQSSPVTVLDAAIAYPSESFNALEPIVMEKNVQTIIQVIGRAYRYGTHGTTRVYLTDDCAAPLRDVYFRWNLDKKGSHVIKQIHGALLIIQPSTWTQASSTPTIDDYCQVQMLRAAEIDKTIRDAIAAMRKGGPLGDKLHAAWQKLRNYKLYQKDLFAHFGTIHVELAALGLPSPFLCVPKGSLVYCARIGQERYLTDSTDPNASKKPYRWQEHLAQGGLLQTLAKKWRHPNVFAQANMEVYIQPWFVQRFMRAILGEYLAMEYTSAAMKTFNALNPQAPWKTVNSFREIGISKEDDSALIEMADLFFYNKATQQLLAIDAKYWGVEQDRRKGAAVLVDAKKKQKALQAVLARTPKTSSIKVSYAFVNATCTKVWQSSPKDNVYVCAATVNPQRDGSSWTLNPRGPFPPAPLNSTF